MSKVESERSIITNGHSNGGFGAAEDKNGGVVVVDVENGAWEHANHPQKAAHQVVDTARRAFDGGRTKSVKFRQQQLKNLIRFLEENEEAILKSLHKDLRKPKQEGFCHEIMMTRNECKEAVMHVAKWAKPQKPTKAMANWFDGVYIYNDPYGVALVMGAWNYPLQLTLCPVVGAIAAGNCVVIKPSDLSPATSQLMYALLPKYLDPECYPVFLGGVPETTELLKEKFDYIFYTGSTMVGKIVHAAANKHLTPTTLELGGKSPTYIDATADMAFTVKRILWGKCTNAGQTCIAPDYILCTKQTQEKFVRAAEKALRDMYAADDLQTSSDYGRIITDRHFDRVVKLMEGLKIAVGGRTDAKDRFIEPAVAVDVDPNHPVMQEEIFGPLLPIVPVRDAEQAVAFVNARDKPLALYVFSRDEKVQKMFLERTSSGGVCINDVVMHCATENLPFGGVGPSGMGAYHGKATFDTFSHKKSVLTKSFAGALEKVNAVRYPPYSQSKTDMIALATRPRRAIPWTVFCHLFCFVLGAVITVLVYEFK